MCVEECSYAVNTLLTSSADEVSRPGHFICRVCIHSQCDSLGNQNCVAPFVPSRMSVKKDVTVHFQERNSLGIVTDERSGGLFSV
jgi:hypothetical protein